MDRSKERQQAARTQKNQQQRERGICLAQAVLARHNLAAIRAKSLADLARWKSCGAWAVAYDEWREILLHGSDDDLMRAMTGTDQKSVWLRTSPPYIGLVEPDDNAASPASSA